MEFYEILKNTEFKIYVTIIGILLYYFYCRKYKKYIYLQKNDSSNGTKSRGKCPPAFPNGWYRIMNSEELTINQVKHIDYCGRNIALFRGTNGIIYALHAYCSHMGSNLGIGGKVKYDKCIQCPFHGWIFDGETGECILSENGTKKIIEQFEYNDIKKNTKIDGSYFKKCYEGGSKLKKYLVKEIDGVILVWIDSRDEFHDKPYFKPFDLNTSLEFRGESINFVNAHIQEIPENGADIRHFDFLHSTISDYKIFGFLGFVWKMKSYKADDPKLYEYMKHSNNFINEFKMKLFKKYINEENKKYLNIISLDSYLRIFKWEFFFFNVTGFQVGPALVYLFLKSIFFEAIFSQSIVPLTKFNIRVSHRFYTSWYIPYFLSAYMLYSEVRQLFADMSIWNNKIFGSKLSYNLKTEADKYLIGWRNWYSQFYDGCYEYEKKSEELNW
jgi:cholesterol 7-dehydrogenase